MRVIDWAQCEGVVCNGPVKCGTGILLKLAAMMGFEQRSGIWLQDGKGVQRGRLEDDQSTSPGVPLKYSEASSSLFLSLLKDSILKSPKHEDRPVGVLGPKEFIHSHLHPFPAKRVVTILRDPRDAAISWIRWNGAAAVFQNWRDTDAHLIDFIRAGDRLHTKAPWVRYYRPFLKWRETPERVVYFEDIFKFYSPMLLIRHAWDCSAYEPMTKFHEKLQGGAVFPDKQDGVNSVSTFTGTHSNWEERWTPEIQRYWHETGGDDLVEEYYAR